MTLYFYLCLVQLFYIFRNNKTPRYIFFIKKDITFDDWHVIITKYDIECFVHTSNDTFFNIVVIYKNIMIDDGLCIEIY